MPYDVSDGLSDVQDVEYVRCRTFGMCNVWDVGCSECERFEMWDVRGVGCSGCEMSGMWDVGDMGCFGCGMWDVFSGMWDVELQNAHYCNNDSNILLNWLYLYCKNLPQAFCEFLQY